MKTIILMLIMVFLVLGIFFFGIIVEEGIHIIQGEGAKSICVDYNLKMDDGIQKGYLVAHTEFSNSYNLEEFYTWREYTEKYALIFVKLLTITLSIGTGVYAGIMYKERFSQ